MTYVMPVSNFVSMISAAAVYSVHSVRMYVQYEKKTKSRKKRNGMKTRKHPFESMCTSSPDIC